MRVTLAATLAFLVQLSSAAVGAQTNYPRGNLHQTSSQSTNSPNIAFIQGSVTVNYYNCVVDPTTPSQTLYSAGLLGIGNSTIGGGTSTPLFPHEPVANNLTPLSQASFNVSGQSQSIPTLSSSGLGSPYEYNLGNGQSSNETEWATSLNHFIGLSATNSDARQASNPYIFSDTNGAPLRLAVLSSPHSSSVVNLAIKDLTDTPISQSWLFTSQSNNRAWPVSSSVSDPVTQFLATADQVASYRPVTTPPFGDPGSGTALSDPTKLPWSGSTTLPHFAMGWDSSSLSAEITNLQTSGKKIVSWTISYSDGSVDSAPGPQPLNESTSPTNATK